MKKLLALLSLTFVFSLGLMAQEVDPPASVWEIFTNLHTFFGSIYGAFALLVFLAPIVIGAMKIQKKILKYVVTTVLAGVIVALCFFIEFGYLYGAHWIAIPLNILGLMLAQIGVFAIPFIKDILEAIEAKFTKD